MPGRYSLNVSNVGEIDSYSSKKAAIAEARKYHDGTYGGRGAGEACVVLDTETDEVVHEIAATDRRMPKTRIEVTKANIVGIKHAILCLPDDERLTGPYAELWAMMLQAEDRLAKKDEDEDFEYGGDTYDDEEN